MCHSSWPFIFPGYPVSSVSALIIHTISVELLETGEGLGVMVQPSAVSSGSTPDVADAQV